MRPIVLVHGIARFDVFSEWGRRHFPFLQFFKYFQYFNGIAALLNKNGFSEVFLPNLDWASPSSDRTNTLKLAIDSYLARTGATKVDIIAHSMGGLDSRRMIADMDMAEKVASLTTIGTPHLGTILADDALGAGGEELIDVAKDFLCLDLRGNGDLTTIAAKMFNERRRDAEAQNGVVYQTYSACEDMDRVFTPLLIPYKHIFDRQGENDGLVPVGSQKWTTGIDGANGVSKEVHQFEFPFSADHLNEVGWWDWEERNGLFDGRDPGKQKEDYEQSVRDIYLAIARNIQEIA
jgi:triacylglycerol lipase